VDNAIHWINHYPVVVCVATLNLALCNRRNGESDASITFSILCHPGEHVLEDNEQMASEFNSHFTSIADQLRSLLPQTSLDL